jgi:hypothetical protein
MTRWLRAGAIAIAVAGAVDPAWTLSRPVKPEVALITADRLPAEALPDRVAAMLAPRFNVVRGASFGASATVLIGDNLPANARIPTPLAFAIQPSATSPFVSIVAIDAPDRGQLQSRIPIRVRVRVQAAEGREVAVVARHNGIRLDSVTKKIAGADVVETIALGVVASTTGRMPIEIAADVIGTRATHVVDTAIGVAGDPYNVLAFDRRPSWMATFVRRALEGDARFVVSSRIATSRGATTRTGQPPENLTSLPSLEDFQTVLVGAPDELTTADAAGLESFLRRGGSVVLLMDEPAAGPAIEQLTGVGRWKLTSSEKPTGTPPASEVFHPVPLPVWFEQAESPTWSTNVGLGQLIVSGALDSWRFRDSAVSSAFDQHWRRLVADASARVQSASSVLEEIEARHAVPDERVLVQSWASANQGRVIPESSLETLPAELARLLTPPSDLVTMYPMRSGWWILPFGLLLGIEWWMRRRSGLT